MSSFSSFRNPKILLLALSALLLTACGGGDSSSDTSSQTQSQQPIRQPANTSGRLLASNCFQCHGTNGKGPGFDTIGGKSASEIYKELKEFRSGKEGNGIMAKHAMGYTDAQLQSLAAWLATQK